MIKKGMVKQPLFVKFLEDEREVKFERHCRSKTSVLVNMVSWPNGLVKSNDNAGRRVVAKGRTCIRQFIYEKMIIPQSHALLNTIP